jgi:hypothetical protein
MVIINSTTTSEHITTITFDETLVFVIPFQEVI